MTVSWLGLFFYDLCFVFWKIPIVKKNIPEAYNQLKPGSFCTVHTRHFVGPDHILGHNSNKAFVHAAWLFYKFSLIFLPAFRWWIQPSWESEVLVFLGSWDLPSVVCAALNSENVEFVLWSSICRLRLGWLTFTKSRLNGFIPNDSCCTAIDYPMLKLPL